MKAVIPNLAAFKGQYLRHIRENTLWHVTAVGRWGVTAYQVDADGKDAGPETTITWRGVQALYTILVGVEQIDDRKLVKP